MHDFSHAVRRRNNLPNKPKFFYLFFLKKSSCFVYLCNSKLSGYRRCDILQKIFVILILKIQQEKQENLRKYLLFTSNMYDTISRH